LVDLVLRWLVGYVVVTFGWLRCYVCLRCFVTFDLFVVYVCCLICCCLFVCLVGWLVGWFGLVVGCCWIWLFGFTLRYVCLIGWLVGCLPVTLFWLIWLRLLFVVTFTFVVWLRLVTLVVTFGCWLLFGWLVVCYVLLVWLFGCFVLFCYVCLLRFGLRLHTFVVV